MPRPSWKLLSALWMLSLVPVLGGIARLAGLAGGSQPTPENARFITMPAPVVLHALSASVFCVLGALQFDPALRLAWPRLHRAAGRVVAPCGILAALTGLWMTVGTDIPEALQGGLLYTVRIVVGSCMVLAILVSVREALRRRVAQHSAWMVRAYALGQGAGTQVLMLLPVSLLAGAPTFVVRDVLLATAWGLNLAFAEWIIRRRLPAS